MGYRLCYLFLLNCYKYSMVFETFLWKFATIGLTLTLLLVVDKQLDDFDRLIQTWLVYLAWIEANLYSFVYPDLHWHWFWEEFANIWYSFIHNRFRPMGVCVGIRIRLFSISQVKGLARLFQSLLVLFESILLSTSTIGFELFFTFEHATTTSLDCIGLELRLALSSHFSTPRYSSCFFLLDFCLTNL